MRRCWAALVVVVALLMLDLAAAPPGAAQTIFKSSDTPKALADADAATNATDQAIPDQGTINSTITIAAGGEVGGVRLLSLSFEHTFPADLDVFLRSPQGTEVELFTDVCGGADWTSANTGFQLRDDPSLDVIGTTCPPGFGMYRPEGDLGTFVGEQAAGTWTLIVTDDQFADTGQLLNWTLLVQPTTRSSAPVANGTVGSVAVRNVRIEHGFPGNSRLALQSPQGTVVDLYPENTCGGGWTKANTGFSLRSRPSLSPIGSTCPPGTGTYRPAGDLGDFVGEPSFGIWQLLFTDLTQGGGLGTLHAWSLEVRFATCRGEQATVVARPGEVTFGTPGRDVIVGTRGPDDIRARGGNDLICSLGGADRVIAGGGHDVVIAGGGHDVVIAGGGNDVVIAGGGNDVVRGGGGHDTLRGGAGRDSLFGEHGRDFLAGGGGPNDLCDGGPGRDSAHRSCEFLRSVP